MRSALASTDAPEKCVSQKTQSKQRVMASLKHTDAHYYRRDGCFAQTGCSPCWGGRECECARGGAYRKMRQSSSVRQCVRRPIGELVLTILARASAIQPPSHRNPEQFHEDKSELIAALRRLLREVGK